MHDDAYIVLGVSRHASDADLRSAYRRQALITHPDKGGTAQAFRTVVQAFETLADVRRRAAYERAVFGPEKRDSPSRRASQKSEPRVPAEAPRGENTKRRRREADGANKNCPPRAKPQERENTDPKHAPFPNRPSTAIPAKNRSERPRPACSKRLPTGKFHTGKSSSVTRLIEELVALVGTALIKMLNELSDATLAEIEAFLRDDIGGDQEQDDVGQGEEQDGTMGGESSPSEEAAAALALTWGEEEDVMSSSSGSDRDFVPCDVDFESRPRPPEDGVKQAARAATVRPVAAEDGDARTTDVCDEVVATPAAVGNSAAKHGDVVVDGTAAASMPPPRQQSARGGTQFRGVKKVFRKFQASVGIEGIMLVSSHCDLDMAIDIHIILVRMRQIVIARIHEGSSFPDALREVDALVMAERQCQTFDWRLSYRVKLPNTRPRTSRHRTSRQTRNIDEAIALWEKTIGTKFQKRATKRRHVFAMRQERLERLRRLARVRSEIIEKKQAEKIERKRRRIEKRQKEMQQRMERQRQMQERREARLLLRRKRFLLARTRHVLRKRLRRQERALLGSWGVRKFPMGVEAASLHQANDSVCCVLWLSDGSIRRGPPRFSLKEAEADAIELSALQSRRGDAVACAELERRDVAAMTAYFLQVV